MATPNNFLNRYTQFPYALPLNSWGLSQQNPYSFNTQLRYPSFPQPFNFSYLLPQQGYYSLPQTSPLPSVLPSPLPVLQPTLQPRAGEKASQGNNKIQKIEKKGGGAAVIQISDDEDPAQQQKPSQDKSTSSNSKQIPYDSLINTKTIKQLRKQQITPNKKQEGTPTPKKQNKITKTKEIYKINTHKKKLKSETHHRGSQQKKGQIFSQRIIEKKDAKKQPYRLSKKERQLLEISFLRELVNEVLTGPQFQAKLPPFQTQTKHSHSWKNELKASLLERMEKNQE